jgi:hypothetical protein
MPRYSSFRRVRSASGMRVAAENIRKHARQAFLCVQVPSRTQSRLLAILSFAACCSGRTETNPPAGRPRAVATGLRCALSHGRADACGGACSEAPRTLPQARRRKPPWPIGWSASCR